MLLRYLPLKYLSREVVYLYDSKNGLVDICYQFIGLDGCEQPV